MMKGSEQVRFQIQYLRAFSIAPLPSLRDRLQDALPNFCRQSHTFIRILVRERPARMGLYSRPKSARDSYQLVVMIERMRLVVWGITRKDPIWVQFRARHPGASHLLWVRRPELKIAIEWEGVSRRPSLFLQVRKLATRAHRTRSVRCSSTPLSIPFRTLAEAYHL